MGNEQLGRLVSIDLREVWKTEAGDFTPWLAQEENITLLGEAIGLELEVEAQEREVGPFRADILCKDTLTGNWVLIENQLERTDHTHLGQLLTYAAGLKAVTIVWIADRFTEEHRAALDWLNEITDGRFNFFGIEAELWRIGGSPIAPKFNLVSKPNDWTKTITRAKGEIETTGLTDAKRLQQEYWVAFRDFVTSQGSTVRPTKPLPQHWMNLAVGRAGFRLTAVASNWNSERKTYDLGEIRAELVLEGQDSQAHFALLHQQRELIESELGEPLEWYEQEGTVMRRAFLRKDANIADRTKWTEQHTWLKEKLEALRRVFSQRVKKLDARDYQPPEEAQA